jgi:hypothetical protein
LDEEGAPGGTDDCPVASRALGPATEGAPTSPQAEGDDSAAPRFGLTTATALIVGTIIGVGIFNLPTSLAAYGPISLVSMALTTVGAQHQRRSRAHRHRRRDGDRPVQLRGR